MSAIKLLDIEASGLHFDSYPIEIAIMIGDEIHAWLIRPEANWTYWSEDAQALHGIKREQLIREGLPAAQVAREINTLLRDSDGLLYSDAAPWDEDWLKTLFAVSGEIQHCHVLPLQDFFTADQVDRYRQLKQSLMASGEFQVHRAASDLRIIARAFASLKT